METCLLAASRGNQLVSSFLEFYNEIKFFKGLTLDMTTNVMRFTRYMQSKGFTMNNIEQELYGFRLFPQQLLCGKDWQKGRYDDETTYAVHDYAGTWGKEAIDNKIKHMFKAALYAAWWKIGNL